MASKEDAAVTEPTKDKEKEKDKDKKKKKKKVHVGDRAWMPKSPEYGKVCLISPFDCTRYGILPLVNFEDRYVLCANLTFFFLYVKGTIRFIGPTKFKYGITWVGFELDKPVGKNSGWVKGNYYLLLLRT